MSDQTSVPEQIIDPEYAAFLTALGTGNDRIVAAIDRLGEKLGPMPSPSPKETRQRETEALKTRFSEFLRSDSFLNVLAAREHDQWIGWMGWMVEKWDQLHASGERYRERWARLARTPYLDLSEADRESDRVEARKVIDLIFREFFSEPTDL